MQKNADVVLSFDDEELPGHSQILALWSERVLADALEWRRRKRFVLVFISTGSPWLARKAVTGSRSLL